MHIKKEIDIDLSNIEEDEKSQEKLDDLVTETVEGIEDFIEAISNVIREGDEVFKITLEAEILN